MIRKNFPNVFPVPIFKVDLRHACLPLLAIGSKKRRSRRNKRVIAACLRYPNIPLLSLSNLLTRTYPTAPYPACCLPRSGRIRTRTYDRDAIIFLKKIGFPSFHLICTYIIYYFMSRPNITTFERVCWKWK